MGTWAADSFSNDGALDWLQDFVEAPTMEMLRDTLEYIATLDTDDYLEAPDCEEAIVAAEIVAALSGKPSAKLPDDLMTWLATDHGLTVASLLATARSAMNRIVAASELQELWAGSDLNPQWLAEMSDLTHRLT